jgi:glc operon protein GlcG
LRPVPVVDWRAGAGDSVVGHNRTRMYQRPCLALSDVRRALDTVLDHASTEPQRPIAVAIVDDRGDLLMYARMDGTPAWPARFAERKAYTAAMMRVDTSAYQASLRERGASISDGSDGRLTSAQGGVAIVHGGVVVGGIGVSGHRAERDEELARLGIAALNLG